MKNQNYNFIMKKLNFSPNKLRNKLKSLIVLLQQFYIKY